MFFFSSPKTVILPHPYHLSSFVRFTVASDMILIIAPLYSILAEAPFMSFSYFSFLRDERFQPKENRYKERLEGECESEVWKEAMFM